MEKILIIEDDIGISNSLKIYLENSNYEAFTHSSGELAIEKIKEINPNLIILDINLPVKSGIDICKELRTFSNIPIVMLTAKSSETDKIIGLELGADDYISKPFSPRELLVRIKTILRRLYAAKTEESKHYITFRDFKIDTGRKQVFKGEEEIIFTKNEYDILLKIVENNGEIVSREIIMKEIIGYEKYIYDRTIDTHIKNIRKKLGSNDIIATVRGAGYRLNK